MSSVRVDLEAALSARYLIEGELGAGAAATVYLAHDLRHDRKVALKVLHTELAALLGAERFLNEIRITAQLDHPNIIPLYDSGEIDGYLYYTMPCVDGETLRQRLDRERQLAVDDAVALARGIAAGLQHAHDHNIVHRDLKPENILLHRGAPLIADFGIAAAIDRLETDRLTATGVSIGTPKYMSPEMVTRDRSVSAATDIYALGTVLYEMLAGDAPFTGSNVNAIISRIVVERPTPLRVLRASVPVHVETAVARALAKVPADRFTSAVDFADAIARPATPSLLPAGAPASARRAAAIAGAILVTGLLSVPVVVNRPLRGDLAAQLADTRWVVLPLDAGEESGPDEQLYDALTAWDGIDVVPLSALRTDGVARATFALSTRADQRTAARARAGRYVRLQRAAESLSVVVRETRTARVLADTSVAADDDFAQLSTWLLLKASGVRDIRAALHARTRSYPALMAFTAGHAALRQWDLRTARAHFDDAVAYDADLHSARFWSLQTLNWDGRDPAVPMLQTPLLALQEHRASLSAEERALLDALVLLAQRSYPAACAAYGAIAAALPNDFAGWFGVGECLTRDQAVVQTGAGWRYRSGYHSGVEAYVRALRLLTRSRADFRTRSIQPFERVLFLATNEYRTGHALGGTAHFEAFPEWDVTGDTLALYPYPVPDVLGVPPPATAVERHRELLQNVAREWAAAFPRSAHAWEAVAIAQDVMAQPEALGTFRRARVLAADAEHAAQLGASEVMLLVKLGLPRDTALLRRARLLTDTMLANVGDSVTGAAARHLAAAAALTGRAGDAARLTAAVIGGGDDRDFAGSVAAASEALVVFAALGGPADSVAAYERLVDGLITSRTPIAEHAARRYAALRLAVALGIPHGLLHDSPILNGELRYLLLRGEAALLRGDMAGARRYLAEQLAMQRPYRTSELPFDGIFLQAWLAAQTRDTATAVRILDSAFSALRFTEASSFSFADRAASLVHALMLRADLAAAAGSPGYAAHMAAAAATLWADADPALQPHVARMRALAPAGGR